MERRTRAVEALARETTVPGLLRATCEQLVRALNADGCSLSRVLGEILVDFVEYSAEGRSLQLGLGYLIADYPQTEAALRLGEPRITSLLDDEPDPAEAPILEELGFDSLLQLPLAAGGGPWGLLEIYAGGGRRFSAFDASLATAIAQGAGELLDALLSAGKDAAHFGRTP